MDWMGMNGLAAELLIEKDALHIYAAIAIQLGAAAVSRRRLTDAGPWLAVLAFELVNEILDIWLGEEAHLKPWQWIGATHDVLNTMALPSLLLLLCRYRPGLFTSALGAKPGLEHQHRP